MATDLKLVSDFTVAAAAADLRGFQHRAIANVAATGMNLHTGGSSASAVFILQNKPNSGDACAVAAAPSQTKAWAGGAVPVGAWVVCATSGGFLTAATSQQMFENRGQALGIAMAAANSGDVFTVALR